MWRVTIKIPGEAPTEDEANKLIEAFENFFDTYDFYTYSDIIVE